MKTLKDAMKEAMQIMLDTVSWKEPEGITTDYPHFDQLVRGLRPGSLTVLASRAAFAGQNRVRAEHCPQSDGEKTGDTAPLLLQPQFDGTLLPSSHHFFRGDVQFRSRSYRR